MNYRGKKEGHYGNRPQRGLHAKSRKFIPFPKKELEKILTVDRKIEAIQKDIDTTKFDDIRNDLLDANNKVWKAIEKADETRET